MIDAKVLRAMAEAGASMEVILKAVEAEQAREEERKAERRAANAAAQRKRRQAPRQGELFDPPAAPVPTCHDDIDDTPSPSLPPSTPTPITTPPPIDDDDGARRPMISARAIAIADRVMEICGIDRTFTPPGWCGAAYRVEATWLRAGWTEPLIEAGVRAAMGRKRDGPPETINYFEKPIRQAEALAAAALPNVVSIRQEGQNDREHRGNHGIHPITAARDRAIARLDKIIEAGRS